MTGPDPKEYWDKIVAQGNKIRDLKSSNASKTDIQSAVDVLLKCKQEYKDLTGEDYVVGGTPAAKKGANPHLDLWSDVKVAGDKVRDLKAAKAGKSEIIAAVNSLLDLKTKYKDSTGEDYDANKAPGGGGGNSDTQLWEEVKAQGDKVLITAYIYIALCFIC